MKKLTMILTTLVLSLLGTGSATATDLYPWANHAAPFTFLFGNDIDIHQQTRLTRDGSLFGFFYIQFTGVVTKDRYRVATHVDCNASSDCTVGWILNGKPRTATLLYHVEPDHPVFLVNRADIPEPGAYAMPTSTGWAPIQHPGRARTGICCNSRPWTPSASSTTWRTAPRAAKPAGTTAGLRSTWGSTSPRTSTS